MHVCSQCFLPEGQCECPPPIRLITATKGNLRKAADQIALLHERHSLTERDKFFLSSIGAQW